MEFLVEFEVNVPDGAPESEVKDRETAEPSAAAKLVDEGHLGPALEAARRTRRDQGRWPLPRRQRTAARRSARRASRISPRPSSRRRCLAAPRPSGAGTAAPRRDVLRHT